MVYKAGAYAAANSVGNHDLGARVWLKLSKLYFRTFQDQEARPCWVTAALKAALLISIELLRCLSHLTAQHTFFTTVLPLSQRNCISVPSAIFEGVKCSSLPPAEGIHAEQKSPKGAGTPQQLYCPGQLLG